MKTRAFIPAPGRITTAPRSTVLVGGALLPSSTLLGYLVTSSTLGSSADLGEVLLLATGLAAALALKMRGGEGVHRAGAALFIVALGLVLAFFVGLVAANGLENHRGDIAVAFGLATAGFLAGGVLTAALVRVPDRGPNRHPDSEVLKSRAVRVTYALLFGVAAVNFLTGTVPLLSSNIDHARLAGNPGALRALWAWAIGGVEWMAIAVGVAMLLSRRITRATLVVEIAACGVLFLLASRNFFVLIGVALLIALATLRGVKLTRFAAVALAALPLLGAAGEFRKAHSSYATGTEASPVGGNVVSAISRSASIGPTVFAAALDEVPSMTRFQRGAFLLRDLRAAVPLHPFDHPSSSDFWVTNEIRHRDSAQIGGSPPTLAGGLYIDFGYPGIVLGCLILGALLVGLYRWWQKQRTLGSLVLYSYFGAYALLTAYSYVSLKPEFLAAAALALMLHRLEVGTRRATASDVPRTGSPDTGQVVVGMNSVSVSGQG